MGPTLGNEYGKPLPFGPVSQVIIHFLSFTDLQLRGKTVEDPLTHA